MKHALDAMAQDDFALKEFIKRDLVNVRFLFIDDLGVERASEWVSEQIYSILDLRLYAATPDGKPKVTFFSSNLTGNEFSNRYHGRSVRRIKELAEFLEVK
ncbi:hypothetical protein SAMN06296036_110201 [Pseudobacteriovorax antillogorgiicola]|uniref:IstB-like ATP binding protein n=2 Tax=Pseudobacteriovorax antillogorgiicola TaxID=1513793 RepID=A0A1Y6BXY4_9BACT|nr:hypothetical protein EDD56_1377 [Pseudobacteriovorax antillogorgiicola]SMF35101.1 hypothetical protein SAMN06296036_110201 [Pseudobacteriovorax antillogorgiicola]